MKKFFTKALDIVSFALSNRLSTVLNIILLPLITPYLSLEDFGNFGVYTALLYILGALIPMGQNLYVDNSYFTHRENHLLVWRRSLSIMNYLSLIHSVIFGILIFIYFHNEIHLDVLIFSGIIYLLFSPYDLLLRSYHVYNEKSNNYLLGNSIKSVMLGLTTYILIVRYRLGYLGWVISLGLSNFYTILIFLKIIWKKRLLPFHPLKIKWMRENIRVTHKLLAYQLSSQIINLSDKLTLSYFSVGIDKIGTYSQGYNFGYNGRSLLNGIFNAFAVTVQKLFRHENFKRLGFFLIGLSIIFSISSILFQLWTKEIFVLLFKKDEFIESHRIAGVIYSSIAFLFPYEFLNIYLVIQKGAEKISKIGVIAALINIVLNVSMIPFFGIYASLTTSIITHFILGISFLFFASTRKIMSEIINSRILIISMLFHLIIGLSMYFLVDLIPLNFKILLTIFLIIPLVGLIKWVKR